MKIIFFNKKLTNVLHNVSEESLNLYYVMKQFNEMAPKSISENSNVKITTQIINRILNITVTFVKQILQSKTRNLLQQFFLILRSCGGIERPSTDCPLFDFPPYAGQS